MPARLLALTALLLSFFCVASLAEPVGSETATSPDALTSARRRVEKLATDVAKDGLDEVARACIGLVETLGANERGLEQLGERVQKLVEKSKGEPSERDLERLAKTANAAAKAVAKAAVGEDGEFDLELCRIALAIDSNTELAHRALEHVQSKDGTWHSEEAAELLARRSEIAAALQQSKALQYEVTITEALNPVLNKLYGEGNSAVVFNGMRIESNMDSQRLAEVMRATLKAMAFANWLQTEEFTPRHAGGTLVYLSDVVAYEKYIATALEAGRISEKDATQYNKQGGYWTDPPVETGLRGKMLAGYSPVGDIGGILIFYFDRSLDTKFSDSSDRESALPHWFTAGHKNYVSLAALGCKIPGLLETETSNRTQSTLSETELKLPNAGLIGCKSWLALLVREGRAPSLARCLVDQVAKLRGDLLLRATASVEFLHECDSTKQITNLASRFWLSDPSETLDPIDQTEKLLDESIGEFDTRWERWVLGGTDQISIRERLFAKAIPTGGPAADMFETLNARRSAAGLTPVSIDPALSKGAAKHAAYLELHPNQKTAWPDAHEEYPESEGFTPAGSWAGAHSVIAFNGAKKAIDEWLGTFYHRVPLTHPGLLRIGLGSAKGTCVLDCTSLTDPTGAYEGHYPFDGQRDIPRHFVPELPNPVPERKNQRTLGYPITYQLGPNWNGGEIKMTLRLNGEEVDCFYSTPYSPTNPLLAPDGCYCLMAKQPLESNATYQVQINGPAAIKQFSFRTGK